MSRAAKPIQLKWQGNVFGVEDMDIMQTHALLKPRSVERDCVMILRKNHISALNVATMGTLHLIALLKKEVGCMSLSTRMV